MTKDEKMMTRALELARLGWGFASPNPMVGCVITDADGHIAGQGWHRCWGGPHAEVNAVADAHRHDADLHSCTAYVTLEPCAHYGKTPPCAELLVREGIKRVVIGIGDPFAKVNGRGISILRDAGIDVSVGVLEQECREINRRFFYAHTHRRPWVLLKWAQSIDGFIAGQGGEQIKLSTPYTQVLMHKERAGVDAIMVGTNTLVNDNPSLTCRLWPSRSLRPVVMDSPRLQEGIQVLEREDIICFPHATSLESILSSLYADYGVTSLMVEGGRQLLDSFLAAGLYNELRIEVSDRLLGRGIAAPHINFGKELPEYIGEGVSVYRIL